MLKRLELKNIALIDRAIIDFTDGLNVLSGETGSGKSVVIDSINFVLGAKADKTMIRSGENECSVSAVFRVREDSEVISVLNGMDVDVTDEIIITRKMSVDGKGGIRVNGVPFTVGMLRSFTVFLVDVHGQSEHYSLTKQAEQLKIVDRYAGERAAELKARLSGISDKLANIDKSLLSFGGTESERAIRTDILKFQIEEISGADISDGEYEELLSRRKIIQSASKISDSLADVTSALSGEDRAIDLINDSIRKLSQISSIDEKYYSLSERLKSVAAELEDVSSTAEDYFSDCDVDPSEADKIEDRIEKIRNIFRKYGPSCGEVRAFLDKAQAEYDKLVNFDAEYERLSSEKSELLKEFNSVCRLLSDERKKQCDVFSEKVRAQLAELGMKNASFEVDFAPLTAIEDAPYPENGCDKIEFMFSANLGEPVKPLARIISGGEMSRFMLALKVIISDYQEISTYIFDEIDTGISGVVAGRVAEKFAEISKGVQVVAISHLPQICAMADTSLKISKIEKDDKTFTAVETLDAGGKIDEIVRLIGGVNSEAARKHAEEMVSIADSYKSVIN